MKIEVCVGSLEDALLCDDLGIKRIELNKALELGGLTPSPCLVRVIKETTKLEVVSMLRCRGHNFEYSDLEFTEMLLELNELIDAGTDAVAFGATIDGMIDIDKTKTILDICHKNNVYLVFHMAIDTTNNPVDEIAKLESIGVKRVLTNGSSNTCIIGKDNIKKYVASFKNIEILPGAGIDENNAKDFIAYTNTNQIHGTFKKVENGVISCDKNKLATLLERISN